MTHLSLFPRSIFTKTQLAANGVALLLVSAWVASLSAAVLAIMQALDFLRSSEVFRSHPLIEDTSTKLVNLKHTYLKLKHFVFATSRVSSKPIYLIIDSHEEFFDTVILF